MTFYNSPIPEAWEGGRHWDYFVDLRNIKVADDIIRRFASTFKGTRSEMGGMNNSPNLNWFADIAYDFFLEKWGESKMVLVVGGEIACQIDCLAFFSTIECVNSAFRDVLCEKTRFGTAGEDVFQENLSKFSLEVYMG